MTKEEILRKRNLELAKENAELKAQIDAHVQASRYSEEFIRKNEELRNELLGALNEAYAMKDKYQTLLKEMQDFKKTVKGRNAIERWVFDLKRK